MIWIDGIALAVIVAGVLRVVLIMRPLAGGRALRRIERELRRQNAPLRPANISRR